MTDQQPTIHSRRVGDSGPRVAFLHGLFGQGRNFTTAAKALEPSFTSLLIDLPNHGRSAWTEEFSYADMADRVADHLRADFAADGPVHIVGHSMGGKVAMAIALRHPDLVDRLVVVDIAPASSADMSEFEHLLGALTRLDLERVTRRADADELLYDEIPQRTVRGFLLQNLRAEGTGWRWQANLDLLYRELPTIAGFVHDRGPFENPVLWVAGARSPYIQPEHRPVMNELFPRNFLLTIKDAGHWVHSEQPDAFASALRTFLSAD